MPFAAFLRRRWPWVLGGTALALAALALLAAVVFPSHALRRFTGRLAAQGGQRITFGVARWIDSSTLTLTDVRAADAQGTIYFAAKRVTFGWSWRYVFRTRRLGLIEFDRPELYLGKMLAAFPQAGTEEGEDKADAADPIEAIRHLFYRIRVIKGILWLDNIAPGLPTLPLVIGRQAPFEWTTGSPTQEYAKEELLKIAETDGIRLYSPVDPLVPVLDLGKLRIGFTWEGLSRREIALVSIEQPTVYIGPNLFAFADTFKGAPGGQAPAATASVPASARAPASAAAPAPRDPKEWLLHDFVVDGGQFVITAFGEPGVKLPFTFHTSARELGLDHLDQLSLQSSIKIERQTFDYPSYGLKLTDLDGTIQFSLPLNANNLVQTVTLREANWKGIVVRHAGSSVTFDRTGIYGTLWGSTYGGYLSGDYWVRFDGGFPWHAGLYVKDAEVKEPVRMLAGSHFALSGKMKATILVDAKARDIAKSEARIAFDRGGHMEIASVQDVEQKLPADWEEWRRKIVHNILESFRSYDFDRGSLLLRYGLPLSTAQLNLEGNQGRRNFLLNWRQEGASEAQLPAQRPPRISVQIDKNP